MTTMTISREFGSQGDEIARQAAQNLGYHFADKTLIGTLLSQYGLVEFSSEYNELPGFWERFNAQREARRELMIDMLNRAVLTLAHHGNVVIMGRSGFAILGGYADVLNVRVQAPLAARVQRVMAQRQVGTEQAEAIVKEADRVRAGFVETFYRVPWSAAGAFDLVVNSDKVPVELAVNCLVDAVKALKAHPVPGRSVRDSIQVDPILAKAVADLLKCNTVHS